MNQDQETAAQLTEGMSRDIRGFLPTKARTAGYLYASAAHHELIRLGFHEDRATEITRAVLEAVFAEHELGPPDT